jgi:ABC-type transport system involved in multi-copper enzyme maturation permease subunit
VRSLRTTVETARQTLLLLARHRMVLALLVAAVLPCLRLLIVGQRLVREVSGEDFYGLVSYYTILQIGLPFTALFFGVVAVHGDLEDRTSTYLFLRPIRRPLLLLGKWLAAAVLSTLLVALVVGLTYASAALPERAWRAGIGPSAHSARVFLLAVLLGAPAYAAVGALLGAYFKRPLLIAMAFLIGWEILVSNLPPQSGVRALTIADPLRLWIVERLPDSEKLVSALTFGQGRGNDPPGDHAMVIARTIAVLLALAMLVYSRREYDSRPRD